MPARWKTARSSYPRVSPNTGRTKAGKPSRHRAKDMTLSKGGRNRGALCKRAVGGGEQHARVKLLRRRPHHLLDSRMKLCPRQLGAYYRYGRGHPEPEHGRRRPDAGAENGRTSAKVAGRPPRATRPMGIQAKKSSVRSIGTGPRLPPRQPLTKPPGSPDGHPVIRSPHAQSRPACAKAHMKRRTAKISRNTKREAVPAASQLRTTGGAR